MCAVTSHNGDQHCTRHREYVEPSLRLCQFLNKLANPIRRIHSHGRIPPCVDDSHRSLNYLVMYVIIYILRPTVHVFCAIVGMCTNNSQHSCWLGAHRRPRKYLTSFLSLCTMRSTSQFSTSRKSTPVWSRPCPILCGVQRWKFAWDTLASVSSLMAALSFAMPMPLPSPRL